MSDCVCLYNSGDGDLPEFCSEEVVKARKSHRCSEFRDTIAAGQPYERVAGKWYGQMSTHRTCLLCREIRLAFCCEDGWAYGMLWDDIEDQMFGERGLDSACLEKLTTVEAKQFLQRKWWAWVERQAR